MRWADIDLGALRHNVRRMRELTGADIIAVVKADGYGHGAAAVAGAAIDAGALMLGVADIAEALSLRAAGIDAPILAWLHGTDADFAAAIEHNVQLGVSSLAQLRSIEAAAERVGRVAEVQLKVETGLNRSGARAEQWAELVTQSRGSRQVRVRGAFSHLANVSLEENRAQAERFQAAVDVARAAGLELDFVHLAASEGALTDPHLAGRIVRPGIALYGLSATGESAARWGLRPVMTLRSEIALINEVPAGAGVSYGHDWIASAPSRLALVPIGYADGLPRAASGLAEVTIGGARFPVRGRIAMDQIVVDIGDAALTVGDEVVIWGDPQTGAASADDWAAWAGTIGYELVTKVGRRVLYRVLDGDA